MSSFISTNTENLSKTTEVLDDFVPGDFSYLDSSMGKFVKDAYDVITRNEWWTVLRDELTKNGVDKKDGFMFSRNPLDRKIMDAISNTHIGGLHSGSSMGLCMREIEYIAIHGEREYRRSCIRRREKAEKRAELRRHILEINPDIDADSLKAVLNAVFQ